MRTSSKRFMARNLQPFFPSRCNMTQKGSRSDKSIKASTVEATRRHVNRIGSFVPRDVNEVGVEDLWDD